MVDNKTIKSKVEDAKKKYEETKETRKEKYEETKEKSKNFADNVMNDLYKSIDEIKENIKTVQKAADEKYTSYKQATVQNLDVDLIESDDVYYLKVAVPGIPKEDINIEAGDNDITIEATFDAYINEFAEDDSAKEIVSNLKKGKCVKTVRFESSINIEEISAKFNNGTVIINIPKLIIPKHKVNVE